MNKSVLLFGVALRNSPFFFFFFRLERVFLINSFLTGNAYWVFIRQVYAQFIGINLVYQPITRIVHVDDVELRSGESPREVGRGISYPSIRISRDCSPRPFPIVAKAPYLVYVIAVVRRAVIPFPLLVGQLFYSLFLTGIIIARLLDTSR